MTHKPRTTNRQISHLWRVAATAVASLTLLIAILTTGAIGAEASSSHSASTSCAVAWGSLDKAATAAPHAPPQVSNLRTGRHACFDRIVVDLADEVTGYDVGYVDEFVADGSGTVFPIDGGALIEIRITATGHDGNGGATYDPADPSHAVAVDGYDTFRQVHYGFSFEGLTQIGLGVRARLPFRVFTLDGPGGGSRLVIDVAHRWS